MKKVLSKRGGTISEEMVAKKGDHLSERERVAMEAEKEIWRRCRVRFMKDKIGEVFNGVLSGLTAFGFFVYLKDVFVQEVVRVTSLHDDYYLYHENQYSLFGERTHKTFRIGDEVKVGVDRVDVERKHIDLGLIRNIDIYK